MDWSFPKQIAVALVILGVAGGYPLIVYGNEELTKAVLVAATVMTVNVLLGYAAIMYSFHKSMTTFFKVVLGGMGIRMLFLTGVLLLCVTQLGFRPGYLVGSMGLFYVVFLTLEVMFIQTKVSKKQQQ
jgi:hypothetical protein